MRYTAKQIGEIIKQTRKNSRVPQKGVSAHLGYGIAFYRGAGARQAYLTIGEDADRP